MKKRLILIIVIVVIMITSVILFFSLRSDFKDDYKKSPGYTKADSARLKTVKKHLDNVLENGRSKVKHTPLLADGINTFDGSFASWANVDGTFSPISNFASQQNFMRALVAYSIVTNDLKYHEEAKIITKYFMDYFQDENNLFRWGGHQFINLDTLKVEGPQSKNQVHELKNHYPFYDLMIEINQEKVENFLAQMWTAHVVDWKTLDINRHGDYSKPVSYSNLSVFKNAVLTKPVVDVTKVTERISGGTTYKALKLPESRGLTFINAGSDLYYAGYLLSDLTSNSNPRAWGKYLAEQYQLARNPVTGLPVYQFSQPRQQEITDDPFETNSKYGDRAQRQFGADYGDVALEGNVLFKNISPIMIDSMNINLYIGKQFNDLDLINWSVDTIKSYYTHALTYNEEDQIKLLPMWNDGQSMLGYTFKQSGYYGNSGSSVSYLSITSEHLLTIVRAFRKALNDTTLWNILREVAKGLGYGDLGTIDGKEVDLNINPNNPNSEEPNNNAFGLLAFVELYDETKNIDYLTIARTIADNIVKTKFNRGYFTKGPQYIYSRIDDIEALALLILDASIKNKFNEVPVYLSDSGYVHGEYLDHDTGLIVESGYETHYVYRKLRFD